MARLFCMLMIAGVCWCTPSISQEEVDMTGKLLFHDDFSQGMDNWWVEGGEKVWIEDNHLHMKADGPKETRKDGGNVCTVWCKKQFPGDIVVEFDAHVIESRIDANNINFFMCYSDPSGAPLYDTRESRADAGYKKYHNLTGHIFTFLNDFKKEGGAYPDGTTKARFRMRRCPGFKLMTEAFGYHCRKGRTYHITITKKGGDITYAVDGKVYMKGHDDNPLTGGLIGLRTYQTYLWWDNIKVTQQ
ncbi:MAG: DUF1961 family protein [Planctomycetes bacterium]|nr:DUF1961 family protein [Planctomycetota bacterium]